MSHRLDKKIFADRLREARKKKYKSQEKFADDLPVSPNRKSETGTKARQTVNAWEKGTRLPDLENLLEISELLDVDIDYLTGRIDHKKHSNEFICQYTGLNETSVELLHEITKLQSMGLYKPFADQLLRCLDLLIGSIGASGIPNGVLFDIADFIEADHILITDKNTSVVPPVDPDQVKSQEIKHLVFNSGLYGMCREFDPSERKALIREYLKTKIFEGLKELDDHKKNKKRGR